MLISVKRLLASLFFLFAYRIWIKFFDLGVFIRAKVKFLSLQVLIECFRYTTIKRKKDELKSKEIRLILVLRYLLYYYFIFSWDVFKRIIILWYWENAKHNLSYTTQMQKIHYYIWKMNTWSKILDMLVWIKQLKWQRFFFASPSTNPNPIRPKHEN